MQYSSMSPMYRIPPRCPRASLATSSVSMGQSRYLSRACFLWRLGILSQQHCAHDAEMISFHRNPPHRTVNSQELTPSISESCSPNRAPCSKLEEEERKREQRKGKGKKQEGEGQNIHNPINISRFCSQRFLLISRASPGIL